MEEIRQKPVDGGRIYHYVRFFTTSQVVSRISEPSTVPTMYGWFGVWMSSMMVDFFWLWGPVGFGVWLLVFMVATWIWIRSVQTWQWPCNKWASLWLEQAEYEREAQSPEYALIFLGGYMDGVHEALLTVWRLKHGHDVFRRDWQLDFVMVSRYEEGIKGSCLVQRRQGLRYLCDSDWWGSFKGVTSVKVMLRCEDMMPNPEASKN